MQFQHNKTPFFPDSFYHIYNKGNNKEKIFFIDENYIFFLKKFEKYLFRFIDIYAFCLIPNHFHLLVKTKTELNSMQEMDISQSDSLITEQFRLLLMSYAKAINKQERREGSLFKRNLNIKPIIHDNHLLSLIAYIHTNPVHHHLTNDFENYKWSSYKSILSNKATKLKRKEIIELFDGKNNFIQYHEYYKEHQEIIELIEEDY